MIRQRRLWLAAPMLILLLGCGRTEIKTDNLSLVNGLRTAVGSRNQGWLKEAEAEEARRHAAGELGDAEHARFAAIVALARDGNWAEADAEAQKWLREQPRDRFANQPIKKPSRHKRGEKHEDHH